jgi:hypothetical protein
MRNLTDMLAALVGWPFDPLDWAYVAVVPLGIGLITRSVCAGVLASLCVLGYRAYKACR